MHVQRIASSRAVSTSSRVAARPAAPAARRGAASLCRSGSAGVEKALFGEDFGARDPFPGEIESNFGEKVLGNWDTEHIIKPPDAMGKFIGLSARSVPPASELALLDDATRERYRQQVPGWRVVDASAGAQQSIQREWTAKDAASAAELVAVVEALCKELGHAPAAVDAVSTTVIARLTTPALGGLTEADFVVAARLNEMDVARLLPQKRQRFWA